MREVIKAGLTEAARALTALVEDAAALESIERAGHLLVGTLRQQGRVLSCGNGGSLCDAMHFAEELSGRFRRDRRALSALAASDPSHLTCVANDFGYNQVFARFVEAHGRSGDALLAITTSGRSPNVLAAAERARAQGMHVIGLTGKRASPLAAHVDVEICTPAGAFSDRVQELHIKVIHLLVELVERELFPENYR